LKDAVRSSFVYPILDRDVCLKRGVDILSPPLLWRSLGLRYFQLRAKGISPEEYLELAQTLKNSFPELLLLANDFARTALANRDVFAGLHLGQEDFAALSPELSAALRDIQNDPRGNFITGISTHDFNQFSSAATGRTASKGSGYSWTYAALGPIAPTASKPGGTDPVLTPEKREEIFQYYAKLEADTSKARDIPVMVLIGGLDEVAAYPYITKEFKNQYGFSPVPAMIAASLSEASLRKILDAAGK